MAPNPQLLPVFNIDDIIPPYIPPVPEIPLLESDSDNDFSSSTSTEERVHEVHNSNVYEPIEIPIEQNLRELLVCIA